MEVGKAGLSNYDKQYLKVATTLPPVSVKPNVFQEVQDPVQMALWLVDFITLSPEAMQILKQLRKRSGEGRISSGHSSSQGAISQEEWVALYREMRKIIDQHVESESSHGSPHASGSRPLKEREGREQSEQQTLNLKTLSIMNPPLQELLGGSGRDSPSRRASRRRRTEAGEVLERMVVRSPSHEMADLAVTELEIMGKKVAESCRQFGVHLLLLSPGEPVTEVRIKGMSVIGRGERAPDGRSWGAVRGLYDASRRLMIIGGESLGNPSHSVARHEFAHAYDHTFSARKGRMLPLSVQLWNLFAQERKGFVSSYASTCPAEYFAESVEAFFHPLQRKKLQDIDRQMSDFLSSLFSA